MRRVAQELQTGPASLYTHVDDRRDLLNMLVERMTEELELPGPEVGDWQAQIKESLRRTRAAMNNHRDIARAVLGNVPTGERALETSEWLLKTLRDARVPVQVCAYAADLLFLYVTAVSFEESLAGPVTSPEEVEAVFSAVDAERYPTIAAMSAELTRNVGDERFEFGLDMLVAGLASTVP
jgi:AcrR family transcriptional regulator